MRRSEILDGILQLEQALIDSKLVDILESMLEGKGEPRQGSSNPSTETNFVTSFRSYALSSHNFNEAARRLATMFTLHDLERDVVWTRLASGRLPPDVISALSQNVSFAARRLPKLAELLQYSYTQSKTENSTPKEVEPMVVVIVQDDLS